MCKDSDLIHTEQIVHPLGIPLGDLCKNKEWLFLIITRKKKLCGQSEDFFMFKVAQSVVTSRL